jgi:AcrR family transcriptional regulator
VTVVPSRVANRLDSRQGHKFAARRAELAAAATRALAELGYARASMRELAQHCGTSLGVLHYYFGDKNDLVMCCVRMYKEEFVDHYTTIVIDGDSGPDLKRRIGEALAETLREHGVMHRLWYDLRTQSLFDDRHITQVREIDDSLAALTWRATSSYARLADKTVRVAAGVVYATADGLFRRALSELLAGDADAPDRLSLDIQRALEDFVG